MYSYCVSRNHAHESLINMQNFGVVAAGSHTKTRCTMLIAAGTMQLNTKLTIWRICFALFAPGFFKRARDTALKFPQT